MVGGDGVRGVILHESALLFPGGGGDSVPLLRPGADFLLRALQFSQLRTGICYGSDLSADKASLLMRIARLYSLESFKLDASPITDAVHEISAALGNIGGAVLFLVSDKKKNFFSDRCNNGLFLDPYNHRWLIAVLSSDAAIDATEISSISCIKKLEELPFIICHMNKKQIRREIVTVGYIMKASRQADFAKRGAFPMYPEESGLMFVPLTSELPMMSQIKELDVVLHKATDEIVTIDLSSTSGALPKITYSNGLQQLRSYLEHQSSPLVIDPFDNIYPVLDRLKIQHVLLGLEDVSLKVHPRIRGPYFLKVDKFDEPNLLQQLSDARLSLPNIVKPQVACGVADAHSMAIVFRFEDYKDLNVPLPAVIQEYVDHSSTLFKVYVLGEKVFYAVKRSIPNSNVLMKSSEANGLKPLTFDSLKSLPIVDGHHDITEAQSKFDLELVTGAANWLRMTLDLTIFGFDVVIQEGTLDHVIVDVNYLPSFKEVPNSVAVPAFWVAIRGKFERGRCRST
ncbi:hypothetical protein Droror1_Dr00009662 [Drosera rotundifolia]